MQKKLNTAFYVLILTSIVLTDTVLAEPKNVDSEGFKSQQQLESCRLEYQRWPRIVAFKKKLQNRTDYEELLFELNSITYVKFTIDRANRIAYFQNSTWFPYHDDFARYINDIDEEERDLNQLDTDFSLPLSPVIAAEDGSRYVTGVILYSPCPEHSLAFIFSLPTEPSIEVIVDTYRILRNNIELSDNLIFVCRQFRECMLSGSELTNYGIKYINESEISEYFMNPSSR